MLAQREEVEGIKKKAPGRPNSFVVNLRYKKPNEDQSVPLVYPVVDEGLDFGRASGDLKFAAAVAGFGMLLRDSRYKGTITFEGVLEIGGQTLSDDRRGTGRNSWGWCGRRRRSRRGMRCRTRGRGGECWGEGRRACM